MIDQTQDNPVPASSAFLEIFSLTGCNFLLRAREDRSSCQTFQGLTLQQCCEGSRQSRRHLVKNVPYGRLHIICHLVALVSLPAPYDSTQLVALRFTLLKQSCQFLMLGCSLFFLISHRMNIVSLYFSPLCRLVQPSRLYCLSSCL